MRKTKDIFQKRAILVTGTVLTAFFAIILFFSISRMSAQAAQTGTVVTRPILEEGAYEPSDGRHNLIDFRYVYQKKDKSEYKVVWYDGTVTTIKNADRKIQDVSPFISTGAAVNLVKVFDENGYYFIKKDGSYFADKKEVGLLNYGEILDYWYKDDKKLHICQENGAEICSVDLQKMSLESKNLMQVHIGTFGDCYYISSYGGTEQLPMGGDYCCIINKQGEIQKEGYGSVGENCLYIYNSDSGQMDYYDTALRKIQSYSGDFSSMTRKEWTELVDSDKRPHATITYRKDLAPNAEVYDWYDEEAQKNLPLPPAVKELELDRIFAKFTVGGFDFFVCQSTKQVAGDVDAYSIKVVDSEGRTVEKDVCLIGDHIIATPTNAIEYIALQDGAACVNFTDDGRAQAEVTAAGTENELFNLEAAKDIVPGGSIFRVTRIADQQSEAANVKEILKDVTGNGRFAAYDISLLNSNNEKVQPKGMLTIRTALPAGWDAGRTVVYRINDDKTYTELKGSIADGQVTFETDHFSTYVIAEKAAASTPGNTTPTTPGGAAPATPEKTAPATPQGAAPTAPATGDTTGIALWAALFAASGMVLLSKKWWKRA